MENVLQECNTYEPYLMRVQDNRVADFQADLFTQTENLRVRVGRMDLQSCDS